MSADPYRYFRVEAHELVEQLERGVIDLERGTEPADVVPRLLRLAHTLKGAARVVRQPSIASLAHSIEVSLAPLADRGHAGRVDLEQALRLIDAARVELGALGAPPSTSSPGGSGGSDTSDPPRPRGPMARPAGRILVPAPDDAWELAAVDGEAVDSLLFGLFEARAHVYAVNEIVATLEELARNAGAPSKDAGGRSAHAGQNLELALAEAGARIAATKALGQKLERSAGELATRAAMLGAELDRARTTTERLRLAPARSVLGSLERVARDAAKQCENEVVFEARGGEIRVDTRTLAGVRVALVQAVRNAVAHGIEPAAERIALGKPRQGHVTLTVERRGERVAFTCEDDGRGIDHDAVRRLAENSGRLPRGTARASDERVIDLLFDGGLSTSPVVSEASGRGVGLSLLRATIDKLRGEVRVRSAPGRGAAIELIVPLTIAGIPSLLVEADGRRFAIALDAVVGATRIAATDVTTSSDGDTIVHDGRALTFAALHRLVGASASATAMPARSAVVLAGARGRAAIGVDRLHGIADVMLRPLPPLAPPCPLAVGAYLDADGEPRLLLDADALLEAAERPSSRASGPAPRTRKPILVIDDSLTTRMLERSILESAGYEVELAISAEEGLERARGRSFGLFLVDVEMPGMDGFSFVELTRADPVLAAVPAVLVTSLDTEADRRRGASVGAAAYIVKGDFDQDRFLATIRTLLE